MNLQPSRLTSSGLYPQIAPNLEVACPTFMTPHLSTRGIGQKLAALTIFTILLVLPACSKPVTASLPSPSTTLLLPSSTTSTSLVPGTKFAESGSVATGVQAIFSTAAGPDSTQALSNAARSMVGTIRQFGLVGGYVWLSSIAGIAVDLPDPGSFSYGRVISQLAKDGQQNNVPLSITYTTSQVTWVSVGESLGAVPSGEQVLFQVTGVPGQTKIFEIGARLARDLSNYRVTAFVVQDVQINAPSSTVCRVIVLGPDANDGLRELISMNVTTVLVTQNSTSSSIVLAGHSSPTSL